MGGKCLKHRYVNAWEYLPLFHGTSSDREASIDKKGLCTPRVCKVPRVYRDWQYCKSNIYLTTNEDDAKIFAKRAVNVAKSNEPSPYRRRKIKPVVYEFVLWDNRCKLAIDPEVLDFDPVSEEHGRDLRFITVGCRCIRPQRKHRLG